MAIELAARVGYIGTGWTERVQIPAFTLGGLAPQAISSGRIENAERVATRFAIPDVHADWRDLVNSAQVDIVSICTPPHLHKEMAIAALRAGKHVICEKPMALNTAEAEAMFAAAQAAPEQLAIIDHELRFHPLRVQMRQMIREGAIGALLRIDAQRFSSDRLDPNRQWTWWNDAEKGGGMLGASGSHLLDISRWLVGRIDSLAGQTQTAWFVRNDAEGKPQNVTADDHAEMILRYAKGVQGRIVVSGMTSGRAGTRVTVTGTEGSIRIDEEDQLLLQQGADFRANRWQPVAPREPVPDLAGIDAKSSAAVGSYYLAQAIATALPLGETVLPEAASFYDGLVIQRALDAVRKSQQDRIWVKL